MSQPPFDPRRLTRALSSARRNRAEGFASTREIASSAPWRAEEAEPLAALAIGEAWNRAAGPALAAVTRVAEWRRGVLVVEVLDRAWEGDLARLRETILESMNAAIRGASSRAGGVVKALELRPAPGGAAAERRPLPAPRESRRPGQPLAANLDERLAQVADRYLRARERPG